MSINYKKYIMQWSIPSLTDTSCVSTDVQSWYHHTYKSMTPHQQVTGYTIETLLPYWKNFVLHHSSPSYVKLKNILDRCTKALWFYDEEISIECICDFQKKACIFPEAWLIVLHSWILKWLSEDEFAAIILHECVHYKYRNKTVHKSRLSDKIVQFTLSREEERVADLEAMRLLDQAWYNPKAIIQLFENMILQSWDDEVSKKLMSISDIFSSPHEDELIRVNYLRAQFENNVYKNRDNDFQDMPEWFYEELQRSRVFQFNQDKTQESSCDTTSLWYKIVNDWVESLSQEEAHNFTKNQLWIFSHIFSSSTEDSWDSSDIPEAEMKDFFKVFDNLFNFWDDENSKKAYLGLVEYLSVLGRRYLSVYITQCIANWWNIEVFTKAFSLFVLKENILLNDEETTLYMWDLFKVFYKNSIPFSWEILSLFMKLLKSKTININDVISAIEDVDEFDFLDYVFEHLSQDQWEEILSEFMSDYEMRDDRRLKVLKGNMTPEQKYRIMYNVRDIADEKREFKLSLPWNKWDSDADSLRTRFYEKLLECLDMKTDDSMFLSLILERSGMSPTEFTLIFLNIYRDDIIWCTDSIITMLEKVWTPKAIYTCNLIKLYLWWSHAITMQDVLKLPAIPERNILLIKVFQPGDDLWASLEDIRSHMVAYWLDDIYDEINSWFESWMIFNDIYTWIIDGQSFEDFYAQLTIWKWNSIADKFCDTYWSRYCEQIAYTSLSVWEKIDVIDRFFWELSVSREKAIIDIIDTSNEDDIRAWIRALRDVNFQDYLRQALWEIVRQRHKDYTTEEQLSQLCEVFPDASFLRDEYISEILLHNSTTHDLIWIVKKDLLFSWNSLVKLDDNRLIQLMSLRLYMSVIYTLTAEHRYQIFKKFTQALEENQSVLHILQHTDRREIFWSLFIWKQSIFDNEDFRYQIDYDFRKKLLWPVGMLQYAVIQHAKRTNDLLLWRYKSRALREMDLEKRASGDIISHHDHDEDDDDDEVDYTEVLSHSPIDNNKKFFGIPISSILSKIDKLDEKYFYDIFENWQEAKDVWVSSRGYRKISLNLWIDSREIQWIISQSLVEIMGDTFWVPQSDELNDQIESIVILRNRWIFKAKSIFETELIDIDAGINSAYKSCFTIAWLFSQRKQAQVFSDIFSQVLWDTSHSPAEVFTIILEAFWLPYIKAGQQLASIWNFNPEIRTALMKLTSRVSPVSIFQVWDVLEQELWQKIHDIKSVDGLCSVASVRQSHFVTDARWWRQIMKFIRPWVIHESKMLLQTVQDFIDVTKRDSSILGWVVHIPQWIINDITLATQAEVGTNDDRKNQEAFARYYAWAPIWKSNLSVPGINHQLSTRLITFEQTAPWKVLSDMTDIPEKWELLKFLLRTVLDSWKIWIPYHADVHGWNIMYDDDTRTYSLIDFGITWSLSELSSYSFFQILSSLLKRDIESLIDNLLIIHHLNNWKVEEIDRSFLELNLQYLIDKCDTNLSVQDISLQFLSITQSCGIMLWRELFTLLRSISEKWYLIEWEESLVQGMFATEILSILNWQKPSEFARAEWVVESLSREVSRERIIPIGATVRDVSTWDTFKTLEVIELNQKTDESYIMISLNKIVEDTSDEVKLRVAVMRWNKKYQVQLWWEWQPITELVFAT